MVFGGSFLCFHRPFPKLIIWIPSASMVTSVISGSVRFSSMARSAFIFDSSFPSLVSRVTSMSLGITYISVVPEASSASSSSALFGGHNPSFSAIFVEITIVGFMLSAPLFTNTGSSICFPVVCDLIFILTLTTIVGTEFFVGYYCLWFS